jgi:ribosomal protein S18 acetylase RimI-like enzyme
MSALITPYSKEMLSEVREIFFKTSAIKEFKDHSSKEAFFYKYLGYYLEHYPQLAFVVVDKNVLGYVVAASETLLKDLVLIQPHLEVFSQEIKTYQAHLHINFHLSAQGQGFGRKLIAQVESVLKSHDIKGLHVMTGPDSQNRFFYQKLGFTFEIVKEFQSSRILFMGKTI